MFNWAKQQLANVAGTQEPIYGPTAIQTVVEQAETTPYSELTREDLTWKTIDVTSVETQTFYFFADSGHIAIAQVIYSNVAGIRTTVQFNTKIFYPKSENKPPLWSTDQLYEVDFNDDRTSFYGENVAIELSEDAKSYTIKSVVNEASTVNITLTQNVQGFQIGKDGTSNYGTDPAAPWGYMRHVFWPRNTVEGTIVTEDGPIDFKGRGLFVHALQGMKPHHAAAKWTFANFQGPKYSAIMMEFTTPASYGTTVVNVGCIVKDGEIIMAGAPHKATFTKTRDDPENELPIVEEIKYEWSGKTKDGQAVEAVIEGALGERLDRVDIMGEVPVIVKSIVAAAAGTKPYIYQYSTQDAPLPLKLKIGEGEEVVEPGVLFTEASFIAV